MSALFALATISCGEPGQHPFRQVQFCLTPQFDVRFMKALMRDVADENGLVYYDRSEGADSELRALRALEESYPIMLSGAHGGKLGFSATNAGLPSNQVTIGFRAPETPEAKALSEKAVESLNRYWDVKEVPYGRGALPIKCG